MDNIFKKRRRELGLSQKDLAQRLGTGQPYISHLEAGKIPSSIHSLRRLKDALGLEIDEMVPPE
jgi:predicted transcriptional regulator